MSPPQRRRSAEPGRCWCGCSSRPTPSGPLCSWPPATHSGSPTGRRRTRTPGRSCSGRCRYSVPTPLVPLLGQAPVDPTGAGDAVTAALTDALLRGADPATAAWVAGAAAALTVARLGGRPRLDPAEVSALAVRSRRADG